jgi:type III pantothenate kinase
MIKLFLDIGNSYVKWATVIDGNYEVHESIQINTLLDEGIDYLCKYGKPDEVYISTVADAAKVDALKLFIQNMWHVFPIQLNAQQHCCGLTSGYDDFTQLGVDRWFALQGAIGIYSVPTIVIDAGTALTIDAVIDGQHQGGFIVPGVHTMRKSLAANTADLSEIDELIVQEQSNDSSQLLATNTSSAILAGTLYMAGAFINQVVNDLNSKVQTRFKVIMTGGESAQLCSLLDFEYDYIPDLVLQGMVNVEESVKKQ